MTSLVSEALYLMATLSAGAVEYTDCTFYRGVTRVLGFDTDMYL